jgi:hypothetical protein
LGSGTIGASEMAIGNFKVGMHVQGWHQPQLQLALGRINPAEPLGGRLSIDVRWARYSWFVGARIDAKTHGVSGLMPVAPSVDAGMYLGVKLSQ